MVDGFRCGYLFDGFKCSGYLFVCTCPVCSLTGVCAVTLQGEQLSGWSAGFEWPA